MHVDEMARVTGLALFRRTSRMGHHKLHTSLHYCVLACCWLATCEGHHGTVRLSPPASRAVAVAKCFVVWIVTRR